MIKAILFDIDGVLIDSFAANLKFYHDLFIKAGYKPVTKNQFKKLFHLTMRDVIREVTKSTSENEIQRIWKLGKDRIIPYPTHLLSATSQMTETIQLLAKQFQLGIVTSRLKGGVLSLPQLSPIQSCFSVLVGYEDTAKHKPDPEPLLLAATQLHLHPNQCVYIGDLPNDIQTARNAKMKIIIYSKKYFPDADLCISSFSTLPAAVTALSHI